MFGGTKPSFGTGASTSGFGGFGNTSTTTAFGQSAFGKPTTSAFGAAPTFGAQQATPSLFGQTATQTQQTGLFGGATTSSAFGATTTTPAAFGGFTQPQSNTSIFGAAQNTTNNSLFGQAGASAFGAAVKPSGLTGFGQAAPGQPATPLFGQQAASTSASGFGGFGQTTATTNVFGSSGTTSAFGQPQAGGAVAANTGTSIVKYQPTVGTDTLMKNGQPSNISTKQHCITAMKEYEQKSLEELRMDDYLAGRKGPQAGGTPGSFFGAGATATQQAAPVTGLFGSTAQPSTGLFGQTATAGSDNKTLFGQNTFGQTATANTFGSTSQPNNFIAKPFGATNNQGFGVSGADTSNPFGAKPAFGQPSASGLFGQPPAASAAQPFGQSNTSGFGGFGTNPNAQQPSMFGIANPTDAAKSTFGIGSAVSGANTAFGGFGTTATSTAGGGTLFGAKTTNAFGTTPAFGATSTANTGFGNFSLNNSGTTGTGLFNSTLNKPATSAFGGFVTQTSAPLNFNTGNSGGALFGNTSAKPGGLFGGNTGLNTSNSGGGGLFGGGTGTFGANTSIGAGFGAIAGNTTLAGGFNAGSQPQSAVPIHQQILAKVTSPYGDTPIFKDLKRNDEVDAARATNPVAQQAILDNNQVQFKVNAKASPSVIKVKPVSNSINRKSLFDGLEQYDASVESFSLKPSAKRLIIKSKSQNVSTGNHMINVSVNNRSETPIANKEEQNEILNENNQVELQAEKTFNKENDSTRRESWLHPNNLQKARQQNLQSLESGIALNSTLTELVPRKPIDTYQTERSKASTTLENPFEDLPETISKSDSITFTSEQPSDVIASNRSYASYKEQSTIETEEFCEPHPTGITLKRVGYYTIPSLDDLKSNLSEDGTCFVPNFTVGREGYGNVYFTKELDVAGLNLDEIVHFRNKEIIVYPDDDKKPPVGCGLNREAQVTLDQVWPQDKSKHTPIKDSNRLIEMDWEAKLRRVCVKNDTRFIDYRPETGSWVFRVKHFSKYGLNDSDEEDEEPTSQKKAKIGENISKKALKNGHNISEVTACALVSQSITDNVASGFFPTDEPVEMLIDSSRFFHANNSDMFDNSVKTMTSPTTTLAQKVALNDAHKVQLMKASFFVEEDCNKNPVFYDQESFSESTNSVNKRLLRGSVNTSGILKNFAVLPPVSQFDFGRVSPSLQSSPSVLSNMRETLLDTSSDTESFTNDFKPDSQISNSFCIRPELAPKKILASITTLKNSKFFYLSDSCLGDLGFYKSHTFKTGFGPTNSLIVPSTHNSYNAPQKFRKLYDAIPHVFKPRQQNDFSPTILQHVKFFGTYHYENFESTIVPHLEVELSNVKINKVDGSECGWFQSNNGTDLIVKHLEESIKLADCGKHEEYAVSVWSLLLALWGDHELLNGQDDTSHFALMFRRNLLSEWLQNTLVDKESQTTPTLKNSCIKQMLNLLMSHRVVEACELALKNDDINLALMLAQLSSGPVVRQLVEDQLASWHVTKTDTFISIDRLKMYMLVAGVPAMNSVYGPINVLEDINWVNAFALQLWYFSSPTCSITDALLSYETIFKSSEIEALPPLPTYKHAPNIHQNIYDMRYHLLHLYSKRRYPLESLLNPETHTNDPMDYRLSWMLLQTLEALGYCQMSLLSECQLHIGFATQLENYGLWEWAIFIAMHIKERNQREISVQNLLYRHVSVSNDVELNKQESFVVHRLGVPEKWIDYAKAVRAGASRQYRLQAKYLLKAKQWALAHEVIYQYIAPDAIINDNLNYLHWLLSQFECTEHSTNVRVPNWSNQGQIFLDFIDITHKFKQIKTVNSAADIEARWENLKPQLAELCSRINLLPCPTSKHRLCQSEIAQSMACFVRGMLIVCPSLNPCVIIKIALERLPLPQEFAKKELRSLIDSLIDDVTKGRKDSDPTTIPSTMQSLASTYPSYSF